MSYKFYFTLILQLGTFKHQNDSGRPLKGLAWFYLLYSDEIEAGLENN